MWASLLLGLCLVSVSHSLEVDDRVYTFAFSLDGEPANYISVNGTLIGQSVDMVMKICEVAGKKCETAVVPRPHCWDTSTSPPLSPALDDRWFDVCANYPLSALRAMNYGFPHQAFFNTPDPSLVVRPGSNITLDDLMTCNDLRLAYPGNTALTPQCVYGSSLWVNESLLVNVKAESDLTEVTNRIVRRVLKDKADIGLVISRYLDRDDVEVLATLPCSSQLALSLNIMTRKDDTNLINWWNDAVLEYFCNQTPDYLEFCQQLNQTYGVDPYCRIPGRDLNCADPAADVGSVLGDATMGITPCPKPDTIFQKVYHQWWNWWPQ